MFTGLIEAICTVKAIADGPAHGTKRLTVDLGALAEDGRSGESIAINGVCLTIAQMRGSAAVFELSTETLAKSTLGGLRPAAQVNIERAMRASDRFG